MFQKLYDFFKNIKTPKWLRIFLAEMQQIIISALSGMGKVYLDQLLEKIIEVEATDWKGEKKFKAVFDYGMSIMPTVREDLLRLAIELLLQVAKKNLFTTIT